MNMMTHSYTKCAYCDHFVEENIPDEPGIAPYIHNDDGEKEHDHDAVPSTESHTLKEWNDIKPELFTLYHDGKIGPNSEYYGKATCQYSLKHLLAGIPAVTKLDIPIAGSINACQQCADFYARMK